MLNGFRNGTGAVRLALAGGVCFALLVGTAAAAPDRKTGQPHRGQVPVATPTKATQAPAVPRSLLKYKLRRRVHVRIDPHTILVRFAHGAAGTRSVRELGDVLAGHTRNATVVRIQRGESATKKLAQYRRLGNVAYAQPNYIRHLDALSVPNDPR